MAEGNGKAREPGFIDYGGLSRHDYSAFAAAVKELDLRTGGTGGIPNCAHEDVRRNRATGKETCVTCGIDMSEVPVVVCPHDESRVDRKTGKETCTACGADVTGLAPADTIPDTTAAV